MAVSLAQFIDQVVASRIMSAADVEAFAAALPARLQDAEQLARELVRQKKLTAFQAQQIYAGKGKGLLLGNYRILDKLGQGGMGMVLKAEHQRMKRPVALKVLSPSVTKTPDALRRFQREVEAAAKLRHPNIVAADDADEAHGVHFLVMEYVEGSDLSAWIKKHGVMPLEKALACLVQAARGLEYAHAHGVVHRDIKPANLLLDGAGALKILDMGLARLDSAGAQQDELTGTGQIMGTVDYMAPEQAMSTKSADARADIYSLGVTLWYLLTARPMYAGESPIEKLLAHQSKPIPSLRAECPAVSVALEDVFLKMVAKAPGDRYQTMTEVIAALEMCRTSEGSGPSLSSATGEDTKLQDFLRGIGTQAVALTTVAAPVAIVAPQASAAPDVTIDTGKAAGDTDPETQHSLPRPLVAPAARPVARLSESDRSTRRVKLLAACAVAGVLLGVFGIWVIVRDKDGNEVARINVPAGGSVAVESGIPNLKSEISNAKSELPNPRTSAPPPAKAPFDAKTARAHQEAWAKHLGTTIETTNSVGAKMILIPPGEFLMGSTDEQVVEALKMAEESGAAQYIKGFIEKIEQPQHRAVITRPLRMGATEVTASQFRKFVEATKYVTEAEKYGFGNSSGETATDRVQASDQRKTWRAPGQTVTDDMPVTQVTWNDAVAYCEWLSTKEKVTYRLPTEAEWEYACRAGTTSQYSFGDDAALLEQFGWYSKNIGSNVESVGTKPANRFGLHDMHGNALEWCQDFYDSKAYQKSPLSDPTGPDSGSYVVVRGGGHTKHLAPQCRSAYRGNFFPSTRYYNLGFRVVRLLDSGTADLKSAASNLKSEIARPQSPAPPLAKAPFDAQQARAHQEAWATHLGTTVETTNSVGAKMILIPPGEFLMGSTDEQVKAALTVAETIKADSYTKERIEKDERPQHRVILTRPLLIGATEVTVGQFRQFVEASKHVTEAELSGFGNYSGKTVTDKVKPSDLARNWRAPGYPVADDLPVTQVSWNDALAYCNWLSEHEGGIHRLPTDAEWEYACRAGTTTQYSFGDDPALLGEFGWHSKNGDSDVWPVGTKPSNWFGLHDLHGNASEWCQDFYELKAYEKSPLSDPPGPASGAYRVVRGGYSQHLTPQFRSAFRSNYSPTMRYHNLGFRVVRVLDSGKGHLKSEISIPKSSAPPPVKAPFEVTQAGAHQEAWAAHLGVPLEIENSLNARARLIPPGEFTMGSTQQEMEFWQKQEALGVAAVGMVGEVPPHRVRLTKPFYAGIHEVTVGQFQAFADATSFKPSGPGYKWMGGTTWTPHADCTWDKPGWEPEPDEPVTCVSLADAQAFCKWLSEKEQRAWRLPTEAEWEYMARAGTATPFWNGSELTPQTARIANAVSQPAKVGSYAANPFGLFDTQGNVWELTADWFSRTTYQRGPLDDPQPAAKGTLIVARGGGWFHSSVHARSACRGHAPPDNRVTDKGFRIVCDVALPPALTKSSNASRWALDLSASLNPGHAHVVLPAKLKRNEPLTVEMFVTPHEVAPPGHSRGLFAIGGSISLKQYEDKWSWVISGPEGYDGLAVPIALHRRVHLAAIKTDSELRLFVDGKRVGTARLRSVLGDQMPGSTLGGMSADSKFWSPFNGTLDAVRITQAVRYDSDFTPPSQFLSDAQTWGLYGFREGGGDELKDSSGNNHHGKIVGAKWVKVDPPLVDQSNALPPAKGAFALEFDANTSVELPEFTLDPTQPLTVEGWVVMRQTAANSKDPLLFSLDFLRLRVGADHCGIVSANAAGPTPTRIFKSDQPIATGGRTHFALVWTGNSVALYIDGRPQITGAFAAQHSPQPRYALGKTPGTTSFEGQLHAVRISRTARYSGPKFEPAEPLTVDADTLALYGLAEGQGETLKDSSGHGRDGKILGARWVSR